MKIIWQIKPFYCCICVLLDCCDNVSYGVLLCVFTVHEFKINHIKLRWTLSQFRILGQPQGPFTRWRPMARCIYAVPVTTTITTALWEPPASMPFKWHSPPMLPSRPPACLFVICWFTNKEVHDFGCFWNVQWFSHESRDFKRRRTTTKSALTRSVNELR